MDFCYRKNSYNHFILSKFYKENKEYLIPGNLLQLEYIREDLSGEMIFELILNVKKVLEKEHFRQRGKQRP